MLEPANISALANLLHECSGANDSDSEDEQPRNTYAKLGPGDLGPTTRPKAAPKDQQPQKNSKDIWAEEELNTGAEYDDIHDPRPQPEYDISYQQAVTTEDMFLQMGNKTPSTSSCDKMVVRIKLTGTKLADIKLDCKDKFVDCRSPKFKLGLHLPHPVDSKNGKAQWDGNTSTLTLTLHVTREYDFMNF